jgi:hypothetical protein
VKRGLLQSVINIYINHTSNNEFLYSGDPKYGGITSYSLVEEHSAMLTGGTYFTNSGAPIVHLFRVSSVTIVSNSWHALL